jgi:hypothetical protein
MPPAAFRGVWAKIDRAKYHLEKMDEPLERFRKANEKLIRSEYKPERQRWVYFLTADPDGTDLAVLTGDIVHNLRGALDHLAYALCVAGSGEAATLAAIQNIHFPSVFGTSQNYAGDRARREIIALAKPGIDQILDATEPYKGGKGEILGQLGKLSNVDKHRLLLTVALDNPRVDAAAHARASFKRAFPETAIALEEIKLGPVWLLDADRSPLKAGRELLDTFLEPKKDDPMSFRFDITLDEPGITGAESLRPFLHRATSSVSDVIPLFDRFV